MANSQVPIPYNVDVGRIKDFVNGVKEAQDEKAKGAALALAVLAGSSAWSSYLRRKGR